MNAAADQTRMTLQPDALEAVGGEAVADADAGLGGVLLVVGEDGDEHLAGQVRVADDERDPVAAGDAVVGLDEQAVLPEALGEVEQETVGLGRRGEGLVGGGGRGGQRPQERVGGLGRGHQVGDVLAGAAAGGEREQVRQEPRAGAAQPLGVEVVGPEARRRR